MATSTPWRAHGWTAHEFRIMLASSVSQPAKIHCEDCGKVFVVISATEYLPLTLCARCYERPCHAGH